MTVASLDTTPRRARRFLFMRVTPLTGRRLANFRANRRGFWSLWRRMTGI